MRNRPKFDWNKALAEQAERRAAEAANPQAPLTAEQRSELRRRQADHRVRSIVRGPSFHSRRSV